MNHQIWRIEEFDEIDSTNTWLVERAREGASEGLVARADFQRAGRGRLGRTWESSAGSALLCSILLRPPLVPDELGLVVAAVALSARDALRRLVGLECTLKWPNDLVVGPRKLGGVLAEVVMAPSGVAVVVGLGLNLTAHGAQALHATSVLEETGEVVSPRDVLDELLETLEERRGWLDTTPGRAHVSTQWRESLSTLGRRVRVELVGDNFVGVAEDLDEHGALVVTVDGQPRRVTYGDVVHLRVEPTS
ncbi:MAG: biotin--[acetyl-CoA-carboxylase] ligase [Acidobacteriota bacterium]|nr:biotin--[acetyl-CoA-carboxylase] ligase [Acidobacteriota bacterium]MDE3043451.1 biotin--[acetyl-CoA-carboxylase] ligase [Acidobacteriota bacterium]MDE3107022.1 biotin--[acetyl-CoA-carboxylase] ligase [Acidobacteriota bacterium]MDE3223642.1 biotin--[acetyl-CoA-carboxylase] ligase [Acidobacteriota bacterium]